MKESVRQFYLTDRKTGLGNVWQALQRGYLIKIINRTAILLSLA